MNKDSLGKTCPYYTITESVCHQSMQLIHSLTILGSLSVCAVAKSGSTASFSQRIPSKCFWA